MQKIFSVRKYKANDLEETVLLWQRCGLVVPWNDPLKDIERKIAVDDDLFLVGERDGLIVASVMAGYDGHRGWLNYLAVAPEERKKGYGRAIVREAEKQLMEKGCPKINLQVRTTNTEVIKFYASLGYALDDVVSMGRRLVDDEEKGRDNSG